MYHLVIIFHLITNINMNIGTENRLEMFDKVFCKSEFRVRGLWILEEGRGMGGGWID